MTKAKTRQPIDSPDAEDRAHEDTVPADEAALLADDDYAEPRPYHEGTRQEDGA